MTNFDAFLAHNSLDKGIVRHIKQKLEHKNSELKLWLDEEQIYGGDTPSDEIKQGISQSKSAVFFIGLYGTGTWQGNLELPIIERLVIESNLGLISVLLPGVQTMPTDDKYSFLRTKSWINYQSIDDAESLDRLLSGITKSRDINIPEQREIEIPPTIPNITLPNDVSKEIALNLLQNLLSVQFQEVIFRYPINEAQLSQNVPQTTKAIEVIKFAIQTEGESLSKLLNTIYAVAPHLRR